ncbi:MAG TPA: carboxypeptidase-like regulatory domain-containing protein [Pirellulales bacterium]|nr:carboxypeptidase-like regulatory domain-containing protein [Pirellulales bacterium]
MSGDPDRWAAGLLSAFTALMVVTGGRLALAAPPQATGQAVATKPAPVAMRKITVRGVCLDEGDSPIAGARVRIFRYPSRIDAPLLVADVTTDEAGKFLARDVETAGGETEAFKTMSDLCVAVTAEGRASVTRRLDDTASPTVPPAIDPFAPRSIASPEQPVVEVSLVLSDKPGTLSGTVKDESGRPVAGVKVFLPSGFDEPVPGILAAITDSMGRYAITDLPSWRAGEAMAVDRYGRRLKQPADGQAQERLVVTRSTFLLDHPDYARTMGFFTAVPQTVDITLHPPAIVEGAVVDAVANRPAAKVVVSAQGVARSGWFQTRTDDRGRYRLRMTKDHYNIWAEAEDRIAIAAKAVEATPGETRSMADIRLVRGAFITGRVIDPATNEPPEAADKSPLRVAHYGPARPRTGAAVTSAPVDPDGTYRLRVAPGANYVYLMSRTASNKGVAQVVTVEDGQELNLDLRIGEPGQAARNEFAADLTFAARLRKEAQEEDAREKRHLANEALLPSKVLSVRPAPPPPPIPLAPKRGDTPVGRLLDKLERQNAGEERFKDGWCSTLKEIVDLGPAAVPELIDELDATQDNMMLRCLGFTLRAIGDQRAVASLIRAIPKTLLPPGSDMGLTSADAELLKFMQQHDLEAVDRGDRYSFGRPVREICGAIEKLTGQKHGEEQLFHIFLDGLASQRRMKRALFQRTAKTWADWWEKEGSKQVDAAYARVNLPDFAPPEADGPPPPGTHFKLSGGGSGWVLESVLNPQSRVVFYDFDTGRASDLPERWRTAKDIAGRLDEVLAWARQEGFDLMGTQHSPPDGAQPVFVLRSIGMRTWELGANRWKMQSEDVTAEALQAEGTPAGELLLHSKRKDGDNEKDGFDPQATATFFYITHEGTPGLLFVGVEVQDDSLKPGGRTVGDIELQPIDFRKGRRFGFKSFEEAKPAEDVQR